MAASPIPTRHWSRKEYEHLVELGVLHEDERIELIGGQMIVAEPKNSPHATAVELTREALRLAQAGRVATRALGSALRRRHSPAPVARDRRASPRGDRPV